MIPATQLLINDHKTVKGLFRQFEAVDLRVKELERDVVREMLALLEIHSKLEEEIFYPACLQVLNPGENAKVEEYLADHAGLNRDIQAIRAIVESQDYDQADFVERLRDMIENVELHVEKEEHDLIPEIDAKISPEQLIELGQKMTARKEELLQMPQYAAAKNRPAQYPNGGEQSRKAVA